MSWDYADMSKDASEHGGPEQYLNSIFESGRKYERETEKPEKLIIGAIFLGAGSLITLAISTAISKWSRKKEVIMQKANAQKHEIIEAIVEQDKIEQIQSLPDNETVNEKEKQEDDNL